MTTRKVMDHPNTTSKERLNDLTAGRMIHSHQWLPKVPLLKEAHVQARLKFASEHLYDSEKAWEKVLRSDETIIQLLSTWPAVFEGREMLSWVKEHYNPSQAQRWKNYVLGYFSANFAMLGSQWRTCTIKSLMRTSFSQPKHWRWVAHGVSSVAVTQNRPLKQQRRD